MTTRLLLPLMMLLALMATGCDSFPDGPGTMYEPKTNDQLIPLHVGNRWNYIDLVSGSRQPTGRYFITEVPRMIRAFGRYADGSYDDSELPCNSFKMETYTDGYQAWMITFDGILFGMLVGEDRMAITHSLPKNPVVGRAYSMDGSLVCTGREEVTTPAGTFDCFRFALNGPTSIYWFSRGVGLIQQKTSSAEGELLEHWVLESYELKND